MALNKKITLTLITALFFILFNQGYSQVFKYWVMFKNKTGTPYTVGTPTAYLTPKSILRRTNQSISINTTDLPVTPSYVSQIAAVPSVTVLYRSKWLNGVVIKTASAAALTTIGTFSFVNNTKKVNKYQLSFPYKNNEQPNPGTLNSSKTANLAGYNYGGADWQQKMLQVDCMHNQGLRGQGITIAVIDDGFDQVNTNSIFDSLFLENRLLGTRDFVSGDTIVFDDDAHGAWCLSTMAANKPGIIIGTAPKAKYWLLRSEDVGSETLSEEYNWIRAAEFADSVGADITTTSLGYSTFDGGLNDHVYATDLDGKTAPMSIAANMASRKGMIVLNAAGNAGGGPWNYITVPSDADSIIAVGAVDSLGVKAGFSSFGPSADGRIKPDLSARGAKSLVCGPFVSCFFGNGTSFATPILAGAVACLWQSKTIATNMQVISALKNTASNFATPNNNIGWGVPQICNAKTILAPLSINNVSNGSDKLILFPNPFTNEINIQFSQGNFSSVQIKITDVLGTEMFNEIMDGNSGSIHLREISKFSNGFYLINISYPEFNQTFKIIKN